MISSALPRGRDEKENHNHSSGLETESASANWQPCSRVISEFLAFKLARETSAAGKASIFKPLSHVLALMYAQLTHSIGLNDMCDVLSLHSEPLSSIGCPTAGGDAIRFDRSVWADAMLDLPRRRFCSSRLMVKKRK